MVKAGRLPEGLPEQVGAEAQDRRPQDAARGVGEKKATPGHPVGSGEKCRQDTCDRNEAAEEDNLAAVAQEEVLAKLDPPVRKANVTTVSQKEPVAELATEPIAGIVPNDCTGRGSSDHSADVEVVMAAGTERSED
jgi:hypothetical protein